MSKKRILAVAMAMALALSAGVIPSTTDSLAAKKPALNKKNLQLKVGEKFKFKLKNAKASKVKWSTSNKKIVTVSTKGLAKGKKAGTAQITARYKYKNYTCKVKVKAKTKVLNILSWNDEMKDRVEDYYSKYKDGKIGKVEVNFIIESNEGGNYNYIKKLNNYLAKNESADANDRIDMFLTEQEFVWDYFSSAIPVSELGITDSDMSEMYDFTKQIGTDGTGVLRGLTWQSNPCGLIYRRSYAKQIFGTDDPEVIGEKMSDWGKFMEACDTIKTRSGGEISMFSTPDDLEQMFKNRYGATENEQFNAAKNLMNESGYIKNPDSAMWTSAWDEGMSVDGKVFAYYGPLWLANFVIAPGTGAMDGDGNVNHVDGQDSYGDWAVCRAPQTVNWGGSWIMAAKGTDNADIVADIMKEITCDQDVLVMAAKDYVANVNGKKAGDILTAEQVKCPVLGDQDAYAFFQKLSLELKY